MIQHVEVVPRGIADGISTIEVQLREIVERSRKAEMALAQIGYEHSSFEQFVRARGSPIAACQKSNRRFNLDLTCCDGYKIAPLILQIDAYTMYG